MGHDAVIVIPKHRDRLPLEISRPLLDEHDQTHSTIVHSGSFPDSFPKILYFR